MQVDELHAGEVGWMSAGIRSVLDARVGDTLTLKGKQGAQEALPGEHAWGPPARHWQQGCWHCDSAGAAAPAVS